MALRFANKIHCIVNNVVAQGLRIQAHALKASAPPPKTRYPLNQQDANSYIESLRTRAFVRQAVDPNDPDVVRTFNVDVHCRPQTKEAQQPSTSNMGLVQRFLATKAGGKGGKEGKEEWRKNAKCAGNGQKGKMVQCKKGGATDAQKCPKMPQDDECPTFKIDNCEKSKDHNCNTRPYVFTDCKKPLAPYPAFSEACYEPLPPSVNECKDCPWSKDYNHPTFKPPMNKFGGRTGAAKAQQKRKFHSDARRLVTLRFGEPVKSKKERRQEELEKQPYAIRPHNLVRKRLAELHMISPRIVPPTSVRTPPKFDFKPLPEDQATPRVVFRTEVAEGMAHENRVQAEKARMEKTLERLENMIMMKNRVRVTGPPQCGRQDCDKKSGLEKKKCTKKIKSKICPLDLLDRKPYKKFREGKKKRAKKHRKHGHKHHKHGHKHHKHGHKKHHKHAAGAEGPAGLESDEGMSAMIMEHNMTARGAWERPSM